MDFLRRSKKHRKADIEELDKTADNSGSLWEEFIRGERSRALNEAISGLPEDMKIAVHLVYFEGLSYEETGKVMKKSRKQIDNLLYRAKGKLKIALSEKGVEL